MQGRSNEGDSGSYGKQLNEGGESKNHGGKKSGKRYEVTKLVTLNIRGLVSKKCCKVQFLNDFVKEDNVSMLCLQETWNKQEYTPSETKIDGYSEIRSVRPGKRGRGGCQYM